MKALTDSINRSGGRWLKRLTVQPAAVGGVRDQAAGCHCCIGMLRAKYAMRQRGGKD